MRKTEIIEIPDFEYSSKGFNNLKTMLKAGKLVRNPFAKFYGDNIEVNVVQASNTRQKKNRTRKLHGTVSQKN